MVSIDRAREVLVGKESRILSIESDCRATVIKIDCEGSRYLIAFDHREQGKAKAAQEILFADRCACSCECPTHPEAEG
jgi:hypothetical protein